MSLSVTHPGAEAIKRWGVFAYCTDSERQKIFSGPVGNMKQEEKRLEREIAYFQKKNKKRY